MNDQPKSPTDAEREIFLEALKHESAEERALFLDRACANNPTIRLAVETLLQHHQEDQFMQPSGLKPTLLLALEKPGARIGRYKLREIIGEGGCGVVYVADQEEPVRRRVALKVIKLGMDTNSVIARFEAERQALAMMDHPNIAKVLDAGATEMGRPYFVMELVRGIRITKYCDQSNLSVPERLKLFTQVCQAIQHAHQKGIIHRDIKPSNILVTLHDGVPVPKVIDFGIAKATEGRLTDLTVYTELHQFIGTPAYMSPEQAEMSGLNIDTRSDIYALGVLLYELLTGQTPFNPQELVKAGLDEMRRTIREQEPQRPSTRLSTMLNADLTAIAKGHGTQAPKLIHLIRGDLDWVVMKALEKDRTRRYETANGLAMDIQRHLNNEPVIARPPSSFYRFQKMVRRNKAAFVGAAAVMVALVAGLVVSTFLFIRERQAQRETQAALARESLLRQKAETGEKIFQANILFRAGKNDEAESLLNQIPAALVQPDPTHAELRRGLGWWHAMHEQWQQAVTDLSVLLQVDVLDDWFTVTMDCQYVAPAMIQCNDTNGYEEFRQALISRFADTTNPTIAARVCKTSLLLPADEKTMSRLAPLYDLMIRELTSPQTEAVFKPWDCLSLALVDYRRGNYPKSIEWCQLALAPPIMFGRPAAAQAILAMASHQLHQEADARAALNQGRKENAMGSSYFDREFNPLFDGLIGQHLLNEASLLIEGVRPPGGDSYAVARYNLALLYNYGDSSVPKDQKEAVKWYRKAVDGGSIKAVNGLAWLLATSPDATVRNGPEAVTLAEKSIEAEPTNAPFLDALAAAYAETGQFEKAVNSQSQAIQCAETAEDKQDYQDRLNLYKAHSPFRQRN